MSTDGDIVPAAITEDVQVRLDTLNYASSLINKNETSLDTARQEYQTLLSEASKALSSYLKKWKSSIEKSRPYHELLAERKKFLKELQSNSESYVTAQTAHDDSISVLRVYNIDMAKFDETDGLKLEIVNDAVEKFNITKDQLSTLRRKHEELLSKCASIDEKLRIHRTRFSTAIRKTQPYFDLQASYNQKMEDAKSLIERLTGEVKSAKQLYSQTMLSLEAISNRIHESRRRGHWLRSPLTSPLRFQGVGAEGPTSASEAMAATESPRKGSDSTSGQEAGSALSYSLPSSTRHTPPGQDDTDTEIESEGFFGDAVAGTLRKSVDARLHPQTLQKCSLKNRETGGEQAGLAFLSLNYPLSRSQSL